MKKSLFVCIALLFAVAGPASAAALSSRSLVAVVPMVQAAAPDVDNPNAVTFTVSADQASIDSYELDILRPDGSVLQTLNLGKPVPDANSVCVAPLNVQPVAFGTGYSVRLRALAGTASSDYAVSENKFNRKPGGPSKVKIGG